MKKLLIDTNIYGEIAIDPDVKKILNAINKKKILIYGIRNTIRNELRDTPKKNRFEEKNLRIIMLGIYDEIVKGHELTINEEMKKLAENYFVTYNNLGGGKGWKEIKIDMQIVACASVKDLDIVVSDDCHSLCSEKAIVAYKIVNDIRKKATPKFFHYKEFKRWIV